MRQALSSNSAASSVTASSIIPTAAAQSSASSSDPKYVVAHHMVGNTFPYTVKDWGNDVTLAHASGIDGFALNIGSDSWQPQRVADAYAAAEQSGTGFKLFLSFDMSVIPCASPADAQLLRTYITTYASHPNQLKIDGRVFASTFAGESCNFGQSSVAAGWSSQFTQHPELSGQNAVFFVPAFFIDPQTFKQFGGVMDGDFNFNSGWPIQVTTSFANKILNSVGSTVAKLGSAGAAVQSALTQFIGSTDTDTQHLQGLAAMPAGPSKKLYMGAVSPWFFTHYGPQSFNKNFIYLTNEHLYARRWESIIAARNKFDIIEIATWNDYGESHYIGPIEGDQPNSQAWVNGFDHTGWLDLTAYYAAAFKTGSFPAITKDKLIMWARPHPANANAQDPVGPPDNFQVLTDKLWAVVMATAPSSVTLNGKSFSVPAGLSKLSVNLAPGDVMHGTISRGGKDVVTLAPQGYTFNGNPQAYNYNAFVASSG